MRHAHEVFAPGVREACLVVFFLPQEVLLIRTAVLSSQSECAAVDPLRCPYESPSNPRRMFRNSWSSG